MTLTLASAIKERASCGNKIGLCRCVRHTHVKLMHLFSLATKRRLEDITYNRLEQLSELETTEEKFLEEVM